MISYSVLLILALEPENSGNEHIGFFIVAILGLYCSMSILLMYTLVLKYVLIKMPFSYFKFFSSVLAFNTILLFVYYLFSPNSMFELYLLLFGLTTLFHSIFIKIWMLLFSRSINQNRKP